MSNPILLGRYSHGIDPRAATAPFTEAQEPNFMGTAKVTVYASVDDEDRGGLVCLTSPIQTMGEPSRLLHNT